MFFGITNDDYLTDKLLLFFFFILCLADGFLYICDVLRNVSCIGGLVLSYYYFAVAGLINYCDGVFSLQ